MSPVKQNNRILIVEDDASIRAVMTRHFRRNGFDVEQAGAAEEAAERFKPAPSFSHYGGPAVWSGDRAVRSEDGLIRFRGRDDAMIKVSGNRLSPTEIEEAALASGAVSEVLALGVKDDRLGQAVKLIAVAKGDNAETRLKSYLAAELPSYMQPREIIWRDALPLSPNGKVDRAVLVKEFV